MRRCLQQLVGSRMCYSSRRSSVLLKRKGREVSARRPYRIYTEEGLITRMKKRNTQKKCKASVHGKELLELKSQPDSFGPADPFGIAL